MIPLGGRRLAVLFVCLGLASCQPFSIPCSLGGSDCDDECGRRARVCHEPTIMSLAEDLDWVQRRIDEYGSVTAKIPDVWGQARLTKYRHEYEREMADELGRFQLTVQGSVARSDQAYLANAMALSAAVQARPSVRPNPTPAIAPTMAPATAPQVVVLERTTETNITKETGTETTKTREGLPPAPTTASTPAPAAAPPAEPPPFNPIDPSDPTALITSTDSFIKRIETRLPGALGFATIGAGGITLEPTERLNQKSRYLQHLQELRRINEGDDVADSPGYALHLMRIPVSVLPGRRTDHGYGAEIMFSLEPVLGPELLSVTFRNLVTNDVVDQMSQVLVQFLNSPEGRDPSKAVQRQGSTQPQSQAVNQEQTQTFAEGQTSDFHERQPPTDEGFRAAAITWTERSTTTLRLPSIGAQRTRNSRFAYPGTAVRDVMGVGNNEALTWMCIRVREAFQRHFARGERVHLPDVQAYVREEVAAAYRAILDDPHAFQVYMSACTPELAEAIRRRDRQRLKQLRNSFLDQLRTSDSKRTPAGDWAWAITVEAALLNVQLMEDIRETASSKGHVPPPEHPWLDFYNPRPDPNTVRKFNEYVALRWPIHVFALDPVTQDQNITDSLSRRRELQFAMSLAFVSGQLSARNLTRYSRRLEAEFETIDLNRTVVGFSHGEHTFGWRFYPRFQTPDTESNLTVLGRDLLWGGPSKRSEIRQRRLEPGARECVALVIMPSFVPYARINVSSNWFNINNPRKKELVTTDAMRISRVVKAIHNCATVVQDADCYRDGDFVRLLAKARQLETRLPLQDMLVQLPYENTLGGFEFFNGGTTDLAPELSGWYGEPGIDTTRETTLFLIGDHFSVHETKVIAGGQPVKYELLSRQVMQVVIPAGVNVETFKDGDKERAVVDIHVATPYGVSPHLKVDVVSPKPAAAAPTPAPAVYSVKSEANVLQIQYYLKRQPDKSYKIEFVKAIARNPLAIAWKESSGIVLKAIDVHFEFDLKNGSRAFPVQGVTEKGGAFVLSDDQQRVLAKCILEAVSRQGSFTPDQSLPAELLTSKGMVTPVNGSHAVQPVQAANQLKAELKMVDPGILLRGNHIIVVYRDGPEGKGIVFDSVEKASDLVLQWDLGPVIKDIKSVEGSPFVLDDCTTERLDGPLTIATDLTWPEDKNALKLIGKEDWKGLGEAVIAKINDWNAKQPKACLPRLVRLGLVKMQTGDGETWTVANTITFELKKKPSLTESN